MRQINRTSRAPRRAAARRGFTLIELVVASVIASILAGAATISIRRLADGRDRSSQRQAAVESVNSITRSIARDMANIVRDTRLLDTIVRIEDTTSSGADQHDEILLFCRSMRPVRPANDDDPTYRESTIHEVSYRLKTDPVVTGVVWRRADPIVDENYEGGGVAVPMGINIRSLDFEAFDGTTWLSTWDSDTDGLPHALRVTCRGVIPSTGAEVASRLTVAIDRIPLPFDPAVDETYDPSSDIENLEFFDSENGSGAPTIDFGGGGGGGGDFGGGGSGPRRRPRDRGGDRGGEGGGTRGGDGGGRSGGGRPRGDG
ncbi:MAG: prepilin-type N-terminal cleavage/methylation domain-containing protein [Phycisphaerales bacterium]|nr:prepilin-type N-terminal cleavage/methylation domain-containing protein [Phycisphaerales bacterium]